ncbi:MAG TPA: LemA family protein [Planctomycetota bacterium]|nr:LemA family protein [Planctomycetota bacterium]
MKAIGALAAGLVLAGLGFFGCAYSYRNQMIDLDEQAKAKWADIETNLQRRLDLVPNLVNTVEGAGKYEGETLIKVTEKRNHLLAVAKELKETPRDPSQAEKLDRLNSELFATMRAFTGIATEAYPQLRATEAYRDLMAQLEGTENRIAITRKDYNASAAAYNAKVRKWGWLPFCGGFKADKAVFQAAPEAQKAPEVKF